MSPVRILPHVRSDQLLKMVAESGQQLRQIHGHPCLVPASTPVIPLFLRRHRPAPYQPEPPEAA